MVLPCSTVHLHQRIRPSDHSWRVTDFGHLEWVWLTISQASRALWLFPETQLRKVSELGLMIIQVHASTLLLHSLWTNQDFCLIFAPVLMNALAGWGVIKCWYKRLLHSYEFKSMASLGRLPDNGRQKWQKPTYCFWIEYSIVSHNLWYNSMGFSGRTSTKSLNQHQIWQQKKHLLSLSVGQIHGLLFGQSFNWIHQCHYHHHHHHHHCH